MSCNKRIAQTEIATSDQVQQEAPAEINFNFKAIDSIRVMAKKDTLRWYTIDGQYRFQTTKINVDYNTYNKVNLKTRIEDVKPIISNIQSTLEQCSTYIENDFANQGWAYDYIVDYLFEKSESGQNYAAVEKADNFKSQSQESLNKLILKRIGIFDDTFESSNIPETELYIILDYWIPDMNNFDKLVVKLNYNMKIMGISIEG